MANTSDNTTPAAATTTAVSTEEQLLDSIQQQIEFYFSDSNLPRDNFLRTKVAEDPNGFVDLSIVASFNRMKSLTEDMEIVKNAVRQSDMLRLSDDGQRVKRTKPLPMTDTTDQRSIYAKGFPTQEMSIDRLKQFFSAFGKVNSVRMRRFKNTHDLKPSAFIEFATEEEARSLSEKEGVKFRDEDEEPLVLMMKEAYLEKAKERREAARQKAREEKAAESEEKEKKQRESLKFTKGCLVRVTGMGAEPATSGDGEEDNKNKSKIEQFKQMFGKYGSVGFVDFDEADSTRCTLRFNTAEDAEKTVKQFGTDEEDRVNGEKPTLEIITGDEETDYYAKVSQQVSARRASSHRGGFGGKRKWFKKDDRRAKKSKAE